MGFEEQGATPSCVKHHGRINHRVTLRIKQLLRGKNTPTLGTLKHRGIANKRYIKEIKQKQHAPGPLSGGVTTVPAWSHGRSPEMGPGGRPPRGAPSTQPANHPNPILILILVLGWVVVRGRVEGPP